MSVSRLFDCSSDRPVLSFIEGFFADEGLDKITIRLKEILMGALKDSKDYSISYINGNVPVLTCKKGPTIIEISEIYGFSNEIIFNFQIGEKSYNLILDLIYGMKNCHEVNVKFFQITDVYGDESFEGEFCAFVTKDNKRFYDGENGYLSFPNVKDNNKNSKRIDFLISDFLDVLEHAIEYGDWKQFNEFCNTDSRDKEKGNNN